MNYTKCTHFFRDIIVNRFCVLFCVRNPTSFSGYGLRWALIIRSGVVTKLCSIGIIQVNVSPMLLHESGTSPFDLQGLADLRLLPSRQVMRYLIGQTTKSQFHSPRQTGALLGVAVKYFGGTDARPLAFGQNLNVGRVTASLQPVGC